MSNWTPSIVPGGDDQNVYLVVSDFGRLGLAWCETDVEATDLETIISDLLDGQYTDPVRVVGFNVGGRWARDVSEDVADEIRRRCDMQMREVPAHLRHSSSATRTKTGGNSRSAWSDGKTSTASAGEGGKLRPSRPSRCVSCCADMRSARNRNTSQRTALFGPDGAHQDRTCRPQG